ncbi:hypothetical protein GGR55DRAFT_633903 [Xylaria sp. FL0064]|nr:hypothetical protein GGR55DRAFT_633903 [Xylaria sp. FL0064]
MGQFGMCFHSSETVDIVHLTGSAVKVRRGDSIVLRRQDSTVQVQGAAMSTANGDVVPYDAANVYKASTEAGL